MTFRSAEQACEPLTTRDRGQIAIQLEYIYANVQRLEQSLETLFERYSRFALPARVENKPPSCVQSVEMSECANNIGNIADECIILVGRVDDFVARCDY